MKMYIPHLKVKLRLTKDWTFSLFCEARNRKLWDLKGAGKKYFDIPHDQRKFNMSVVKLHVGDVLSIERIYIRKDQSGYNSVTMRGWVEHNGKTEVVRFWVVLDNFNDMHAEVVSV